MSERIRNLLYLSFTVVAGLALVLLVVTAPSDEDRVARLGSSIRCPVCQGEPIIDSPSEMARDMMALVTQRVEEGASDDQIVAELLASYTGALLLDPPRSGSTLLLWLAPMAAVLVGATVIFWWKTHPLEESPDRDMRPAPRPRTRSRALAATLLVAAAAVVAVVAAVRAAERDDAPGTGVAGVGAVDPAEVSNETMEAVIAANLDHPDIDGMRLALAERYFEAGDYRSAFPHYLAVAESDAADDEMALTALVRLGWMAWQGNGEVDTALRLFDQALAIDDDSATALYLKGRVLWCGAGQTDQAVNLFQAVLAEADLPGASRAQVSADLEAAASGETCA